MESIRCITFDKSAQDALPEDIKVKMRADRLMAEMDCIQLLQLEGKYFKLSPTSYFKVKSINKGLVGEKEVLSIRTVSYNILSGMLCIDHAGHQTRDLDFDFGSILSSKEELLNFIEKHVWYGCSETKNI